ncbi:MAG: ParB/RepB/Spo0J family partition protein [Chromatiales bacterium]|nr:ParB/RepB/Spo0J family partition protein [Chromatiales bacterium]
MAKSTAKKRRGLGSLGVDALLTTVANDDATATIDEPIIYIAVDKIQPNRYQPRKHIDKDALQELATSIKHQGLLQPIVVRVATGQHGLYELIAGERRWRAAQLADLDKIPAVVKQVDEHAAAAIALVENIQRQDLTAIEEALAIKQLLIKFDMTHAQVATAIGRSRPAVSNLLRLLELTPEVRDWLAEGKLEMAHARTLLQLDKAQQADTARLIMEKQMNAREVEDYIRKILNKKKKKTKKKKSDEDSETAKLERHLSEHLGATVKVKYSSKTSNGSLIIYYTSLDELDNILEKIT